MKAGAIKRLVLDPSVAVAWCFPDESTPFTEGVLDLLAGQIARHGYRHGQIDDDHEYHACVMITSITLVYSARGSIRLGSCMSPAALVTSPNPS